MILLFYLFHGLFIAFELLATVLLFATGHWAQGLLAGTITIALCLYTYQEHLRIRRW